MGTTCFLCGEPCAEDEYCHGCKQHICSFHETPSIGGRHNPQDHEEAPDEDR